MRDDITRLCGTFEESFVLYGVQFISLHHHYSKLTGFISFETYSNDLKTCIRHDMLALSLLLDHHDERFTQFVESYARDQKEHHRGQEEHHRYWEEHCRD